MNRFNLITSGLLLFAGIVLVSFGGNSLAKSNHLATRDNPFGLYESAYGRLLARLAETTIDRVWHLGVEQVVPHYMTGEAHGTKLTEESSLRQDDKLRREMPQMSLIEHSKAWVQKRVVSQFTRTNPYSLSVQHKDRVHKDVARLLARSYRMDPTHYGAYNSYHLFITSNNLGGTEESREFARELGRQTILTVQGEDEDPEPYLTAASAAMNLFLLETEDARVHGQPIELETLKRYRNEIFEFLGKFESLQDQAEDNGSWDYVSMERQVEIMHRFRFTNKTFSQFDAMIARAEDKTSPAPEGQVAEKGE